MFVTLYFERDLPDFNDLETRCQGHHNEQLFPIHVTAARL